MLIAANLAQSFMAALVSQALAYGGHGSYRSDFAYRGGGQPRKHTRSAPFCGHRRAAKLAARAAGNAVVQRQYEAAEARGFAPVLKRPWEVMNRTMYDHRLAMDHVAAPVRERPVSRQKRDLSVSPAFKH